MPLLVQQNTPQGIQLVLRPGTPNNATQLGNQRTQNLILQQSNTSQTPTVLIQHNSRPTTIQQQPQQLVRVLTANGMIQQLATPTFIAMNGQPINLQQLSQQKSSTPQLITQNHQQNININAQNLAALQACIPNLSQLVQQSQQQQITQINTSNIPTNLIQQHNLNSTIQLQQQVTPNLSPSPHQISGNATQIINAVATNTTNVTNALSGNNQSNQLGGNIVDLTSPGGNSNLNAAVIKVIQAATQQQLNEQQIASQANVQNMSNVVTMSSNCVSTNINHQQQQQQVQIQQQNSFQAPKKKPKKKKKIKETKLDLAGLMKLSG